MKSFVSSIVIIVLVFIISIDSPALGYVVTVEVEGVVTQTDTYGSLTLDGSVTVGSVMTGSYTYDTETPDQHSSEDRGRYSLASISMNIGNYTAIHNPEATEEPRFDIVVGPSSYYDIRSTAPLFYGPCYIDGEPTNLEGLDLSYPGIMMYLRSNSIVSDALPDVDSFPDLSSFYRREFSMGNDVTIDNELGFLIGGEITSITVIPEPASAVMLGLGAVLLALRRKQR